MLASPASAHFAFQLLSCAQSGPFRPTICFRFRVGFSRHERALLIGVFCHLPVFAVVLGLVVVGRQVALSTTNDAQRLIQFRLAEVEHISVDTRPVIDLVR